jgi:hypothetical protein
MSYILHPTFYILHPTSYILHPTSYILHLTSYILCPTSYILHPTSYVLCPLSYILCPTPFALCPLTQLHQHPSPLRRGLHAAHVALLHLPVQDGPHAHHALHLGCLGCLVCLVSLGVSTPGESSRDTWDRSAPPQRIHAGQARMRPEELQSGRHCARERPAAKRDKMARMAGIEGAPPQVQQFNSSRSTTGGVAVKRTLLYCQKLLLIFRNPASVAIVCVFILASLHSNWRISGTKSKTGLDLGHQEVETASENSHFRTFKLPLRSTATNYFPCAIFTRVDPRRE